MASSFKLPGTSINFAAVMIFLFVVFIFPMISLTVEAAAFGEQCTDNANCTVPNEECSNDTCACSSGFKQESQACRLPKYEEPCDINCENGFQCNSGTCGCNTASQYYDTSTTKCKTKRGIGQACNNAVTCFDLLECKSQVCQCKEDQFTVDNLICQDRKPFNGDCDQTSHCLDGLSCLSLDGKCGCTSLQYYDGSQCKLRKPFNGDCDQTSHCLDGLSCLSLDGKCGCTSLQYYDGSQCKLRKPFNGQCDQTSLCLDGLSCLSLDGKCGCTSLQYYDGSQCKLRKPIGDNSDCDAVFQCQDTVSCVNNKCGCTASQYQDGSQCTEKKGYSETCDGKNSECDGSNVDCIDDKGNIKKCLCMADYFRTNKSLCKLVTELRINETSAPTRSTNSITFTWKANRYGQSVSYKIINNPSGSSQSTSNDGGRVTGLTQGTQYTFSVESSLSADDFYQEKTTEASIGSFWTKPAKPGSFDASKSQVQTNLMKFAFLPADGNVKEYKLTLKHGTDTITRTILTTQVESLNLTLGEEYSYEIVAFNGNGDESEKTIGFFKTTSASPSKVKNLEVKDVATNSAVVKWESPTSSNGKIYSYVVQVLKENSCDTVYVLKCSDCQNKTELTFPDCGENKPGSSFTDGHDKFDQTITSLTVFTEYTVKVFPVNEAGEGSHEEKKFITSDSAPEDIKDLNVTSVRNSSTKKVGIQVKWTPGMKTGITNYSVTVVDQKDTSKTLNQTITVTGYNNTNTEFPHLLAFHEYNVSVVAVTRLGNSNPSSEPITTKTTTPGRIQSLKVIPNAEYATKMDLEIECPLESERNGIIGGFTVMKQNSSGNKMDYDIPVTSCNANVTVASTRLGSFKVNENYTFKVIAKNQDYSSEPSDPKTFNVVPKPFIFEAGKPGVEKDSDTTPLKNSVTVALCSSCITNPSQGEVTKAGLIVCVKSKTNPCSKSRKKRAIVTFDSYETWTNAKASKFVSAYRTTPDGWIQFLNNNNPSSYNIGDDKSCSKDTTTHCNGPLPSGTEIVVTVIACTVAGCQESQGFVVKTKDDSSDSTGIIVGIIIPIIIIIIVVIAIVIFIRMRRKKKESHPHVPFVDLSNQESRAIKIREFCNKVAVLHKDSNLLFQGEFEDIKTLSSEFKFTCEEAQLECNRVKNRYVDILPYDHTRVKLEISDGEDGSDFINANYIVGLTSQREYIATQGPMHATIPHFWKMAWEQKSKVIVMLSDLTENSKMKVSLYWPENLNEPISYGDVVVEMTNFSQLNKYIIRNFKISMGNMTRRVTHFFIPGWWDFSANLTFDDVLEFAQLVRKETTPPESGPPIVHCSAGVGRTGTFIALDYFMQYIEKHSLDDDIDVFTYVLEMRKCRPRMVQAETQYIFIFDALVEVIKRKIKFEQERLYDNCKSVEDNVYANQAVTENIYANQAVTENVYANQMVPENPYANTTFGDGSIPPKETTTVDFTYTNNAFEPDNLDAVDLSSSDQPTTVL